MSTERSRAELTLVVSTGVVEGEYVVKTVSAPELGRRWRATLRRDHPVVEEAVRAKFLDSGLALTVRDIITGKVEGDDNDGWSWLRVEEVT